MTVTIDIDILSTVPVKIEKDCIKYSLNIYLATFSVAS